MKTKSLLWVLFCCSIIGVKFEIDILTYLDTNLTTKNYESITGIVCYFSVREL